ncbi:MmoB/DmpM family protein [Pseudomonas linyingensis]|nr:MmoB/DmpM family protein [Pseudomonas linyingensis]
MPASAMNWLEGAQHPTGGVAAASTPATPPQRGENKVSGISSAHLNNKVGPVMRQGELAVAVAEAAEIDNPGKEILVEDKVAYLRIQADDEMIIHRKTIEEMLGRPFSMNELEVELSSFAGRIDTHVDHVRFYYSKHF